MVYLYLISFAVSLLVVGLVTWSRKWSVLGPTYVSLVLLIVSVVIAPFPGVLLQLLLTFIAVICCAGWDAGVRGVFRTSLVVCLLANTVVYGWVVVGLVELEWARQRYPYESVAERLAYESPPSTDDVELKDEVEQRLREFEERPIPVKHGSWRHRTLRRLHNRAGDAFVMARGFGPIRMVGVAVDTLPPHDAPPITLPEPPVVDPYTDEPRHPLASIDRDDELLAMHGGGLGDFFDRARIGHVKKDGKAIVAGFVPHRMLVEPGEHPHLDAEGYPQPRLEESPWRVTRLELVSLLRHAEPRAYVSRELPRMEQLGHAPTRTLDVFESEAVDRLRRDEDLVVQDEPWGVRMVGSIRAGEGCLGCHSVQRGQLLGAFTYDLYPREAFRN